LRLKFWGTRGSIPKAGSSTVRYGGNTSCLQLQSSKGTLLVIDCGTGGHSLGLSLIADGLYQRGHMLISHTHWDHIQGVPFFAPFFMPDAKWDIYGPRSLNQSIQGALQGQMQHTYFPVPISEFSANMHYHNLVEGSLEIDDFKITVQYLNHPVLTCGYRIEVDGMVIVYSCDHEPQVHTPDMNTSELAEQDHEHLTFLANADLVIHDAQYTQIEFAEKIGWGHSSVEYAVKLCQQAGVKQLALTHHDPCRSDIAIDEILMKVHKELDKEGSSLRVFAATEGYEMLLNANINPISSAPPILPSACILSDAILTEQTIFIYVNNAKITEILSEAIKINGVHTEFFSDAEALRKRIREKKPELVLLEHNLPIVNGLEACRLIHKDLANGSNTPPIVIISTNKETHAGIEAGATDWLIFPFSSSYACSKIQAWVLRESCIEIKKSSPP
jgi:phosphoribosyl 1,2-cyclic phosphodiesterase/CheY-like chemotaxis protein